MNDEEVIEGVQDFISVVSMAGMTSSWDRTKALNADCLEQSEGGYRLKQLVVVGDLAYLVYEEA